MEDRITNDRIIHHAKVAMEKVNNSNLSFNEKFEIKRILNRFSSACIDISENSNTDSELRKYLNNPKYNIPNNGKGLGYIFGMIILSVLSDLESLTEFTDISMLSDYFCNCNNDKKNN